MHRQLNGDHVSPNDVAPIALYQLHGLMVTRAAESYFQSRQRDPRGFWAWSPVERRKSGLFRLRHRSENGRVQVVANEKMRVADHQVYDYSASIRVTIHRGGGWQGKEAVRLEKKWPNASLLNSTNSTRWELVTFVPKMVREREDVLDPVIDSHAVAHLLEQHPYTDERMQHFVRALLAAKRKKLASAEKSIRAEMRTLEERLANGLAAST